MAGKHTLRIQTLVTKAAAAALALVTVSYTAQGQDGGEYHPGLSLLTAPDAMALTVMPSCPISPN